MTEFKLRAIDPGSGVMDFAPVKGVRNALEYCALNYHDQQVELWRGDVKIANLSSMVDGFWSIS